MIEDDYHIMEEISKLYWGNNAIEKIKNWYLKELKNNDNRGNKTIYLIKL